MRAMSSRCSILAYRAAVRQSGRASAFHAIGQRPPESARPERGVDRVSSAWVGPRRRGEGGVLARLPGASSQPARPRHRVGGHREADLLGQPRSSVGEPWITARFRIKLDPCGSSCKRSRKLAFPGRRFAAGSSSAPARRATTSLPAERSRACRAGTPPWRLRRWSSSKRRSNRGAAEFAASTGRGRWRRGTWLRLCTRAQVLHAAPLREVCALIANRCRQARRRRGRCP